MKKYDKHKNKGLTLFSKSLRNGMTKEERRLWYDFLKNLPVTVNRQKVFDNYIVDFYCARYKLIIELDGTQHYLTEGIKNDTVRDNYFKEKGIKVLRYSNLDINKNFDGVCNDILLHMRKL